MVRAWRRRRDDLTTTFPWGPAASSARGAATATQQSDGWVLGGEHGVGHIGVGGVGEYGVEVRRRGACLIFQCVL